ncbi:MAG: molybdenum cofactor guanylyltransferase [Gemmatimonadaceae bacterium]
MATGADSSRRPAGAILAGGGASRFGGLAKGLERVGGMRIVDRVVAALHEVASDIIVVGAPAAVSGSLPALRAVSDGAPGAGPLGGILTALRATGSDTIVLAWDMPFVTAADLRPLLTAPLDAEASVWELDGTVEPLCALYRLRAFGALEQAFAEGERSPRGALRRLRLHTIARDSITERSPFASVNTPEELAAARARHPSIPNDRELC